MDTLPDVSSLIDHIKSVFDSDLKSQSAPQDQLTPPKTHFLPHLKYQSTNSSSQAPIAEFNILDHGSLNERNQQVKQVRFSPEE